MVLPLLVTLSAQPTTRTPRRVLKTPTTHPATAETRTGTPQRTAPTTTHPATAETQTATAMPATTGTRTGTPQRTAPTTPTTTHPATAATQTATATPATTSANRLIDESLAFIPISVFQS